MVSSMLVKKYLWTADHFTLTPMPCQSGLSPQSPMALALFGSLLVRRGDIKLGGWFSMIAKSLSENIGSEECASEFVT